MKHKLNKCWVKVKSGIIYLCKIIIKMNRTIKDVVIDKISLLTGHNTPAVPKADRKFAILKSSHKDTLANLKERLNKIDDIEDKEE